MRGSPAQEAYAVMVADMVTRSPPLALEPVATHMAFQAQLDGIHAPAVFEHGGRIAKTTSAGFVAIFANPGQGERCGRAIQAELQKRAGPGTSSSLGYRIGLHHGRIVVERDELLGREAKIAMDMSTLAPTDGICISDALLRQLPECDSRRYRYAGRAYLGNLPTTIAVYTHDPTSFLPSTPRTAAAPRSHLSPPPKLAVAAFDIAATTPSGHALATMAHEGLTYGLSRFGHLFSLLPIVAEMPQARFERAGFREHLLGPLSCEYVLHGTYATGPGTLTLNYHLESLPGREVLWSRQLQVGLEDQVDLLDDLIAVEAVAAVALHIERDQIETWSLAEHSEDEIAFRQAKQLVGQRALAPLEKARHLLSEIIRRCGDVADVHIAMARAEHNLGLLRAGDGFAEAMESAWWYAKKAVDLDGLNAHAHAELALQELFLKRQDTATAIYEHALRLNPYDPMLRADWADSLVNVGRAGEAVVVLEEILSGQPRDRAWVEWSLSDAYWALDRPDRTLALLRRHQHGHHAHRFLAVCHAKLGNLSKARRHADKVREAQPGFSARAWREVLPDKDADTADEFVDYLEAVGL